jgi:hypothetical protein
MTIGKSTTARRSGLGAFMLSLIGCGMIAGAAIALLENVGILLPAWLAGLAAVVVGGLTMLWSRRWWVRVDEAVREAHKTAWYWGGSVGMVPVMGLAATLLFDRSGVSLERFAAVPGDGGLILTGIAVTLLLQLVGYGLFWAGWWLSRSR